MCWNLFKCLSIKLNKFQDSYCSYATMFAAILLLKRRKLTKFVEYYRRLRCQNQEYLFSGTNGDICGRAGFRVLVPDETGWAVDDVDVAPEITLNELCGVWVGEEEFVGGDVFRSAVVGEVARTSSASTCAARWNWNHKKAFENRIPKKLR